MRQALERGGPATAPDRGQPHDVEGFEHPRVQDGDFDGVARVDVGALGVPLDLGPKGTLFLEPAPLLLLLGGGLPLNGHAMVLQGVVPPTLAGLELGRQVLTQGPRPVGALDWTKLEHVSVAP